MANEKKITKAQKFTDIKHMLNGEATEFGLTLDEALNAIDHELELIANKNKTESKAKKANDEQNEVRKTAVLNAMTIGETYTAGELVKVLMATEPDITSQRITYLMGKLIDEGKVEKSTEKRKSVYKRIA